MIIEADLVSLKAPPPPAPQASKTWSQESNIMSKERVDALIDKALLPVSPRKKKAFVRQAAVEAKAGEVGDGGEEGEGSGAETRSKNTSSLPRGTDVHLMSPTMKSIMSATISMGAGLDAKSSWPGGRSEMFKPKLLKKLESFVNNELRALNAHNQPPNATRIQVYRSAFSKFADEFRSYSSFLHSVRNEYDSLLSLYSSQLHSVPQVQAEISSLRIGASQKIEDMKREFAREKNDFLDKIRRQSKSQSAADRENEGLRKQLKALELEMKIHKEKHDELKGSNITLTDALVRLEDENTARALVENTQQSEVLRLKSLMEKANEEADRLKNLTVDLEEQVAKLVPPEALDEKDAQIDTLRTEMSHMRANQRDLQAKYATLNSAYAKVGDSSVAKSDPPSGKQHNNRGGGAIVDVLLNEIETLKAQLERMKIKDNAGREDGNIQNEKYHPEGNFFDAKGYGEEVPEFLRYSGLLRNWRLSKRECERAVNEVWIAKEEWADENEGQSIHLSDFLHVYLCDKYKGEQSLIAEFGYNLVDALQRYIEDSDCLIFLKILQGDLAEEVRDDQLHLLVEIKHVMEEEDCAIHSGMPSGTLQIASFMKILRKMLNTKSEHSFSKLQKALQFEAKGRMVAYNDIFEEDEDGNQGDFCELLRAQHLEEIIAYDKKLNDAILDAMNMEGTGKLLISTLREVIKHCDPDKGRADINLYLARGCNCTIQEVVEKENGEEMVEVDEFIARLRDGLLKKSEIKA